MALDVTGLVAKCANFSHAALTTTPRCMFAALSGSQRNFKVNEAALHSPKGWSRQTKGIQYNIGWLEKFNKQLKLAVKILAIKRHAAVTC